MEQRRIMLVRLLMVPLVWMAVLRLVAQTIHSEPNPDSASPAESMHRLTQLADEAHQRGDLAKEVEYRRDFSRFAWDNLDRKSKSPLDWSRWEIVFHNDLPLAILLEGSGQWPEAETIYRRNQSSLAHERLAGNDIKSDNQLLLAHLLAKEGKHSEARAICSYWKDRIKHNADFALRAIANNVPTPPLYDTPEVETGKWKLACGPPAEGLRLLEQQIQAHPGMLAPYTVLSRYYLAEGDSQKALAAERDGTAALSRR